MDDMSVSISEFVRNSADLLDQLELEKTPFILTRDSRRIARVVPFDERGPRRSGRRPESRMVRRLSSETSGAGEDVEDVEDVREGEEETVELDELQWRILRAAATGRGRLVRPPQPATMQEVSSHSIALVQLDVAGLIIVESPYAVRATPRGVRVGLRRSAR